MKKLAYFYCPMKQADDGRASGVPRIGNLFKRALYQAGFEVISPALPTTYDGRGDPEFQLHTQANAIRAGDALVRELEGQSRKPKVWLTYHSYYKSPDLIGPRVANATGCMYAVAEGSFAAKRAEGPWASHHAAATKAFARADLILSATARDRGGLDRAASKTGVVADFPPFIDCSAFIGVRRPLPSPRVCILAAGSMRDERKLASYRILFEALSKLPNTSYRLIVAGDGPRRSSVEHDAKRFGIEPEFLGQLATAGMPAFFAGGDLYAWPGIGEAYGLTYLEAQAAGLPVVATDSAGVSACVRHNVSGMLVETPEPAAFSRAVESLVASPRDREQLGLSARDWVLRERSLPVAAQRLSALIEGAAK